MSMKIKTSRFLLLFSFATTMVLFTGIQLSAQCFPGLPNPVIALNGTEEYNDYFGTPFIRYRIKVTNWADFPDELFVPRPDLGQVGLNPEPARMWVYMLDMSDNTIIPNAFIALGQNEDLLDIWFAVEPGVTPPSQMYVRFVDRDPTCGGTYNSAPINVYAPAAPVAVADSFTTAEDTPQTVNVTANDTDINGDTLTVDGIAAAPAHGTAIASGGTVTYTPAANYNGPDSFSYTVSDGTYTATGSVNVTVTAVGDAPNAPTGILTNGAANPNNVSTYLPLFSWTFSDVDSGDHQTAYEIRIGTTPGSATTWDSGKVSGTVNSGTYGGSGLAPNTTYYWSVRVWDTYDLASTWSASGTFEILDIGLRVFDGTETVRIAVDYASTSTPLRIFKNGVTYGILLLDPSASSASKIRIMTPAGIKALKKM